MVRGLKGVKGIYEESGEREIVMWSVGAKDRPRVFWGMCMCARTWWEPRPLGLLFLVGPPNDNMDPPSPPLFLSLSLSFTSKHLKIYSIFLLFSLNLNVWEHLISVSALLIEYCLDICSSPQSLHSATLNTSSHFGIYFKFQYHSFQYTHFHFQWHPTPTPIF